MKVLQVIPNMHIGGLEKVIVTLCSHLDTSRFQVSVCCQVEKGILAEQLESEGIEVIQFPKTSGGVDYLTWYKLARLLLDRQFDVVHSHNTHSLIDTSIATVLSRNTRWLHTFHFGNYPHQPWRYMRAEQYLGRRADKLVAVGHSQRQALLRHLHLPERLIDVVWNGIEDPLLSVHPEERFAVREELGLGRDDLVAGTVAVLTEQKGIPVLLQALRDQRQLQPNLKHVVVGGGPCLEAYKAICKEYGLESRILFTGWRADAVRIMNSFDIVVMPSLWEAMPIVLLEAMALAKPVIATTVGDIPAMLNSPDTGIMIPPGDSNAIVRALGRLLPDRTLREEIGRNARRRYESLFTATHMARSYQSLYEQL